jgi:hypothetical protein
VQLEYNYPGVASLVSTLVRSFRLPRPKLQCEIDHAALADHFGAMSLKQADNIEAFLKNSSAIEQLARTKYFSFPIEELGRIVIKTRDIPKLNKLCPQS